jgi:5'(3')-deoxyribonucleotidase
MKIGIDLDEVLADFLSAFIEYHNATHQTSLKQEDFLSYGFEDACGKTEEEMVDDIHNFHQTPYFKKLKPIAGAPESLRLLKPGNELFIITSRQDSIAAATKEWVWRYFPDIFSDVFLTNHYAKSGNTKSKKEFCDLLKLDILIDDQLAFALECLAPERKVFLFDRPWNRGAELPAGISRVYSWPEIIKSVGLLQNKKIC